jgi:hypothetical protein
MPICAYQDLDWWCQSTETVHTVSYVVVYSKQKLIILGMSYELHIKLSVARNINLHPLRITNESITNEYSNSFSSSVALYYSYSNLTIYMYLYTFYPLSHLTYGLQIGYSSLFVTTSKSKTNFYLFKLVIVSHR